MAVDPEYAELVNWAKDRFPQDCFEDGDFVFVIKRFVTRFVNNSYARNPYASVREYLVRIRDFLGWHKTNPTELVNEAVEDLKLNEQSKTYPIDSRLKSYERFLTQEGRLKQGSIGAVMRHLKSFFKYNNIPIVDYKAPRQLSPETEPISPEWAFEAIANAETLRDKAILHLLFASGLSIGDALALKRDDVKRYQGWGYVKLYREKTGVHFLTIITPECMERLERYLKTRRDNAEWLFVTHGGKHKWLSITGFQNYLNRLADKMGLLKKGKPNPLRSRAFRAGFRVNMMLGGVDGMLVEYMMGHSLGVANHYSKYPPEKLVEMVRKHYEEIRLEEKGDSRVGSLETRVAELEKQLKETEARLRKEIFRGWEKDRGEPLD